MSFEARFPVGDSISRRSEAGLVFDGKERDDHLGELDTEIKEEDTSREERIEKTNELMGDLRKDMSKRHEFTVDAKLEMLENVAELGVESVLAEIVAERYGFPSFKAAMDEFGVYKNGATVYGDIVDKGSPESAWTKIAHKGWSDFKKASISGTIGSGLALSGLAAVGLFAAPAITAVIGSVALTAGVGVFGSAIGSTIAKGVARHFTRKSLFEKQNIKSEPHVEGEAVGPPTPRADVPEGMEWQGSIAQKAAEDMVSFIKEAQLLAKQALKFADEQATLVVESEEDTLDTDKEKADGTKKDEDGKDTINLKYSPEEIQTYKLQHLNSILRSLDTNSGPHGEENIFGNVGAYQQGVKKAEKKERWAGVVGGIAGSAGLEVLSHGFLFKHLSEFTMNSLKEHGMWMQNGHPSAEHVGHLVKEVNGGYHYQIDHGYHPPTPDAGTAHGILNQQDLQPGSPAMAFLENHLRHAHQTFFGDHIPFDTMAHDQLMQQVTEAVTTPGVHHHGFSLTQETLDAAQAGHVDVFHAGVMDGAAVENSILSNLAAFQFAEYAAILGGSALAEPLGEAMVAGREKGIREKIRREGIDLVRMSFSSDILEIPKPTPPPTPPGPEGMPMPPGPITEAEAEKAAKEKEKEEAKALEAAKDEEEKKKFLDFETKFMNKNDGTENFSESGKQIAHITSDHKLLPGEPKAYLKTLEGGVDTYAELKDALNVKCKAAKAASPYVHNIAIMMPSKYYERILASSKPKKTLTELRQDLMNDADSDRTTSGDPGFEKGRDSIALIPTANGNSDPNSFPQWREHLQMRAEKRTKEGENLEISSEKLV